MKPSTEQTQSRPLEWLDRGGGPFVIVPGRELSNWAGVGSEPSDFDRACEVGDYLDTISFAGADALVLGDDPFPTTFLAAPQFGGGYLIRMLWGEDTTRAIEAVHRLEAHDWTREQLTFDAGRGSLVLFDAANAGAAILHRVDIPVGPGHYAIDSADVQPDESLCLLVHRLIPLS